VSKNSQSIILQLTNLGADWTLQWSPGAPGSADTESGSTWELWRQVWEHLGSSGDKSGNTRECRSTFLGILTYVLRMPRITGILFRSTVGAIWDYLGDPQ